MKKILALVGALVLSVGSSVATASDIFLCIPDAAGESKDKEFAGCIDAVEYRHILSALEDRSDRKCRVVVEKPVDHSSPEFWFRAGRREPFSNVEAFIRSESGLVFWEAKMQNVTVQRVTSDDSKSASGPMETVHLIPERMKITYTKIDEKGITETNDAFVECVIPSRGRG